MISACALFIWDRDGKTKDTLSSRSCKHCTCTGTCTELEGKPKCTVYMYMYLEITPWCVREKRKGEENRKEIQVYEVHTNKALQLHKS